VFLKHEESTFDNVSVTSMPPTIHDAIADDYQCYRKRRLLDKPVAPGGKHSLCPIDFGIFSERECFYQLERFLGVFVWKNRIVGLLPSGLLCVTSRDSKLDHYVHRLELISWHQVRSVHIARKYKIGNLLLGLLMISVALLVFTAVIISNLDGIKVSLEKVLALSGVVVLFGTTALFGVVLVVGFRRIRIDVSCDSGEFYLETQVVGFSAMNWFYRLVDFYCDEQRIAFHVEPGITFQGPKM